ncbi:hypothetical protein TESS_TESS_00034 [Tessaracoccus sp. O5.2]
MFIPIAADDMGALDGSTTLRERPAHTVTPELLAELGYSEREAEDAEHAAMVLASVAGLARHGTRLVIVAEVDPSTVRPGEDSANGEVVVEVCPTRSITAWFADEPGADVGAAAAAARGLSIDEAWELPEVQDLLQRQDLLWNDVVEYRRATGGGA